MNPLDILLHLASFAAPAVVVAILVAVAARFLLGKASLVMGWWGSIATNFAAGLGACLGGIWYFGNDGKMATYACLVLMVATCQWLGVRGWRR